MIYVRSVARKPPQEAQELHQARCYLLLMDLNGRVAHLNWWEKSGSRLPPNASEGRLVGEPWIWGKDESAVLLCVLIGPLQPVQLGTGLAIC